MEEESSAGGEDHRMGGGVGDWGSHLQEAGNYAGGHYRGQLLIFDEAKKAVNCLYSVQLLIISLFIDFLELANHVVNVGT